MGSHLLKTGTAALHVREALPSSFTTIRKDVLAEKHLLFSEAHPSHFHKKQKEAAPAVPASYFFLYSKEIPGRLRQGISDCSFPRKTRRRPGGVFRQKFPLLSCRGISVMSSRRDSRRILRMGPPEELLISPSLPTSFPSTDRSLPCRRCWRKPSRSRFCPGSGKPSSSPARNPHRPCQNPFSPPG